MKSCVLLLSCVLAASVGAQSKAPPAKNAAEAEKKIEILRKEIRTLTKAQRELEEKRNREAKQLRQIDQKVAESSKNLNQVESAINSQERKLNALETEQEKLERALRGQKQELAQLMRSAYRLGDNSELKQLLSQDKISEVARWLAYHRYFEQQRQLEIGRLNTQLQQLAAVSDAIEQEKQILAAQKVQQEKSVADLSAQRKQRSTAVSTLDAKYKNQQARIKALGKDEKALRGLLDKLRQAASTSKAPAVIGRPSSSKPAAKVTPKNLTGWPLTGTLLAGYGNAMPDGRRSEGLLIAAAAGSPVYTVAAGRVVYADWLKGYGMLMVIDHGRGNMSLYANNDALLKDVGESVTPGERIATVGTSGAQSRAALYFEMRLNGQPQNPNTWLRP
ncbi:murein hydrolase activator EnvC family protein [Arenimonas sp.]|jgi:septal ring factor EnvC (AmiA/AmiB activator)|uniref:murein hydrolase activator EnvC family protein n=1 Tax=Arenimonas sp. TaxID=1872635 RepID=UPI0037C0EFE8